MNKFVVTIIITVLVVAGSIVLAFKDRPYFKSFDKKHKEKTYKVVNKWELPEVLEEVSGISWLSENKIACVQDEDGIIFIYDLKKNSIDREINFGDNGDYEAIASTKNDAYVMRSDGTLFVVNNFQTKKPSVKEFDTPLYKKNNIEGLALDIKKDRLLLAAKDRNPDNDKYKAIYGYSLKTNQLDSAAILDINLEDKIFKEHRAKKLYNTLRPSEIAINPVTGEFYILEGVNPKLLILDTNGNPKKIHYLDPEEFNQPEGITFSPSGTLYISNEGRKDDANILEVELK